VLLGSALSSHTLIAFPILTRLGIVTNEAVSVTVGATVFTDVTAFIVLAIITGMQTGDASVGQLVTLIAFTLVFAAIVLVGLPRLGKLFFRKFTLREVEFQFVVVALFVTALAAEAIGVHAVVGAFLAGLAINSTLPHHSPVIGRVLFLGEAFFIPVFLIYSGMITDPLAFVTDTETITIGIGLTVVAYVAKFIAAWLAARVFRYSHDELWTVFGLSQAQAAVTLPTVLVGVELGLFPQRVFSGTMLMILFTSITSPLLVQRFGARLRASRPPVERKSLFDRILVPLANPETREHLITLASILAQSVKGTLYPMNVALKVGKEVLGLEEQKHIMAKVPDVLDDPETRIQAIRRVDTSIAAGILHEALENDATLIIMGWPDKPAQRAKTALDEVIENVTVPVIIGRLTTPINAIERVTLALHSQNAAEICETLDLVTAIADAINVPLLILADKNHEPVIREQLAELDVEESAYQIAPIGRNIVRDVIDQLEAQDLAIVTTNNSPRLPRSGLGPIVEQLAAQTRCSLLALHYPAGHAPSHPATTSQLKYIG
jgi:hypothetical protein